MTSNTNIFNIPSTKLTAAQRKFVALELRKPEIQKWHEEMQEALAEVEKEIGDGGYFQDANGVVYKILHPEGKFVYFEKYGYVRTKRDGESRGTLSVKEAREQGFKVPD